MGKSPEQTPPTATEDNQTSNKRVEGAYSKPSAGRRGRPSWPFPRGATGTRGFQNLKPRLDIQHRGDCENTS